MRSVMTVVSTNTVLVRGLFQGTHGYVTTVRTSAEERNDLRI